MEKKTLFKRGLVLTILLALAFVFSLMLTSNPWAKILPGHDSSMFIYMGKEWVRGGVPYLSFTDHKGPSIMLVNALGWLLPHVQVFGGIWWLEYLAFFFYALAAYRLLRINLDSLKSILAIFLSFLALHLVISGGNITEVYALPAIMWTLYAYWQYFDKKALSFFNYLLVGFGGAFTFNLRANLILSWLPLLFFMALDWLISRRYDELKKGFIGIFSGIGLYVLPMGIYLAMHQAFSQMLYYAIQFNLLYVQGTTTDRFSLVINWVKSPFGLVFVLSGLMACLGMLFMLKNLTKRRFVQWLGFFLSLLVTFAACFMSGRTYAHYFIPMVAYLLVLLALFLQAFEWERGRVWINTLLVIGALGLSLPQMKHVYHTIYTNNTSASITSLREDMDRYKNGQLVDTFFRTAAQKKQALFRREQRAEADQLGQVIDRYAKADDTIYIHRQGGAFYLTGDRPAFGRFFNLPAMDLSDNTEINQEFITTFKENPPAVVVLKKNFYKGRAHFLPLEQAMSDELATHYKEIKPVGHYFVYVRK